MYMEYSNFKLWSVGQGLFYTGKIQSESKSFNFVYDCGGSNENIISEAIDDYLNDFNPQKEIDFLIISHFDRDHINGLHHLLKNINKIKKIFIPYSDTFNSYFLLIAYLYGNNGDLSEKVDNIILVNTSQSKGGDGITNLDELRLEDNIDETYKIGNISVSRLDFSSYVSLGGVWKFKFYNVLLEEALIGKVKQDIDNLVQQYRASGLEDLLSNHWNNSVKNGLKNIYDSYVPENRGNGFKNSSQNQASLCLYHSPLIKYNDYEVVFKHINYKRYFPYFWGEDNKNVGTLLTGDLSLRVNEESQKYDHFRDYFSSEKDEILFFLVPHHGAMNNWNSSILTDFKNVNFFINSAGLNNRYGHPDSNVIKEILATGSNFLWTNENNCVEYGIFSFEYNYF